MQAWTISAFAEPLPRAALERLIVYIELLTQLESEQVLHTSSQVLAEMTGSTVAQVRKDLSYLGRFGTRGQGYSVPLLRRRMIGALGLDLPRDVAVVGTYGLGRAVAEQLQNAHQEPFRFIGLYEEPDYVPKAPSQYQSHYQIKSLTDLQQHARPLLVCLSVEPERAARIAKYLTSKGVTGIVNLSTAPLPPVLLPNAGIDHQPTSTPSHLSTNQLALETEGVRIENVDFFAGLKRLSCTTHKLPENKKHPIHTEEI